MSLPALDPDIERCISCGGIILDGDEVYSDESGGVIHARCCGPERESYLGEDGNPLKEGDPIPAPWKWSAKP